MNASTSLSSATSTSPNASASASATSSAGDSGPNGNSTYGPSGNGNGNPYNQYENFWPGPVAVGQAVCAAGLYNVTDACCTTLHGALWIPDDAGAAHMFGARQHMCLLFSNTSTVDSMTGAFQRCASRPGTGGNAVTRCDIRRSSARRRAGVALGAMWVVAGCVLAV